MTDEHEKAVKEGAYQALTELLLGYRGSDIPDLFKTGVADAVEYFLVTHPDGYIGFKAAVKEAVTEWMDANVDPDSFGGDK